MSFGMFVVVPIVAVVVMMGHDSRQVTMDLDIRVQVFILRWVDCLLFWTAELYLSHDVRRWKRLKSDDLGANRNILLLPSRYFLSQVQTHEVTISHIQEYDRSYFEVIVEYSVLKVSASRTY